MRIAVIVQDDGANAQYRALMPTRELSRRGHSIATIVARGPDQLPAVSAFAEFDAVLIWRLYFEPVLQLAKALAASGIALLWDNDDDITSIPRAMRNHYAHYGGVKGHITRNLIGRMLQIVNIVTTPSPVLAGRYRDMGGRNVRVIENYVPTSFLKLRRENDTGLVIGWTGSMEHQLDWQKLRLAGVFERLLERHPRVKLMNIGFKLGVHSPRYTQIVKSVPYQELPSHMARFDVGIAPLADIPFNRARSNVKLKEYAALGIPWLASPIGPYASLGQAEGGRLVGDDEWFDALEDMLQQHEERRRLAARATVWSRGETIARNVHRWEDAVRDAVELAHAR